MIVLGLLFLALSTFIGCIGSLMVGHLVPTVSVMSLLGGFALAAWLAKSFKYKFKTEPISLQIFILYAVVAVGIYFHSAFLFYFKAGSYWIQDAFNLGDMSFHWSAIRSIGKGAHFWPENPIYEGFRFRYPFAMDFFNAFFENLGIPMAQHLPFVTLLMLVLTFATLHFAGGPLLVFAVFFSCGFYNIFGVQNWDHYQIQQPLDFKNIFLTILVTQRGFLYAMPAGVFLYRAVQKYFAGAWKPTLKEQIILGIIWGALGFFHLHTYFFVSMFFGLWILWKKDLKNWLVPVGVAVVMGAPFVLNALWPEAGTNSLVHWNWRGWARPAEVGYFSYWATNLGFWIVAVVTSIVIFARKKHWNELVPVAMSFLFFILFSHLILAPWDWDNIKLLVWCYLFALMGLNDFLWNDRGRQFRALVCLTMIPGFIIFVRSLPPGTHGIQWASERELNKAEVLMKDRDINDVVMISPAYDHPVMLLGAKLFMGYPGHVWSHGYNYTERENLVNRIYDGDPAAVSELPAEVKWIYGGPVEKRRAKLTFPQAGLVKAGEAIDHEIYSVDHK